MMSLLHLENAVQRYREQHTGREFEALRVHELDVQTGEILAVVGPNGSGKSTLLEILAFLQRPGSGRVLLDGVDVWAEGKALEARRRCPILLQKTLLFSGPVLRNVMFSLRARGVADARRRAQAALETVGMQRLAHRRHNELSGGEQRRVALARLLALDSDVLILDEPTASLDQETERLIEDLIRTINHERGATVIMASHNFRQAVALATRVVTLLDGKLIPAILDNVLLGAMRRTVAGFEFRERRGWTHVFQPGQFAEDRWEGVGPLDGPVQLAIPSTALDVAPITTPSVSAIRGEIDAVRKNPKTHRIRIRTEHGLSLSAEVPFETWSRLKLALGSPVALTPQHNAIRVLPVRPSPKQK